MPPSEADYEALYSDARAAGLSRSAAEAYATLTWWGLWYDLPAPSIVSGYRSAAHQAELRREWSRYGRNGPNRLAAAPARSSAHSSGEAFDLQRVPHLWIYGEWAPLLGLRWGGTFQNPDPVHFDRRA